MVSEKEEMIQQAFERADQAIKSAGMNIENNWLTDAENRIYYAIFYSVVALAYFDGFETSKHSELMGWFNKKYIYQEKVFEEKLFKIYKSIYKNRMMFDYDFKQTPLKEIINQDFADAKYFIQTIKSYIDNNQ